MRRFRWLLVASSLMLVPGLPALANQFGSDDNNWYYNESNFQRYWYASSLNSDWVTASNWTRNNNINPTDMYTETRSAHDNSDVSAYVGNYGEGEPIGEADCISYTGPPWICLHWHVRFNTYYSSYFNTLDEKKHMTCHEYGHTTGLRHYPDGSTTNSCMKVPSSRVFSVHDENHIDNYYPANPNG